MRIKIVSLSATLVLLSAGAFAMPGTTLYAQCTSEDDGLRNQCTAYVRGFIDGAVTTDPEVVENVVAESKELSPWMLRAIRTSTGQRIETEGGAVYASFCLGTDIDYDAVVTQLVSKNLPPADTQTAEQWVYEGLKKGYPCSSSQAASNL